MWWGWTASRAQLPIRLWAYSAAPTPHRDTACTGSRQQPRCESGETASGVHNTSTPGPRAEPSGPRYHQQDTGTVDRGEPSMFQTEAGEA